MKRKVLSYLIFFMVVAVVVIVGIKGIILQNSIEKGEVKRAKMIKSVNITKEQKMQQKAISQKDNNKTIKIVENNKSETSTTTLKFFEKQNKKLSTYHKERKKREKKDLNQSKENIKLKEEIFGVDSTKVKLHKIEDFNTTTEVTPLIELLEQNGAELGDRVLIRIFKSSSLLEVWIEVDGVFKHLKSYTICAYSGELGPKLQEGDKQAPEGFYEIKKESLNFNSKFHLAMDIGYPNRYDKEHNRTGSYIMIHGGCVSVGCFAMGDRQIEEIYDLVESAINSGQKSVQVQIYPFRMTQKELQRHSQNRWFDFWVNLKEGYELFEKYKRPLIVDVKDGNYTFR